MKALSITIKTIKYILITVMLIIFVANFYVMIMSATNPGTHPSVFGYSTAVVVSGSMQPEINVDDVVVIKEQKAYEKGDVIAFSNGKSFVTHRIHEVVDGGFVTKGDANNTVDDGIVRNKDVSGEVIFTLRGIGKVVSLLKSPLGLMILFVLGFIIIAIPDKKENENKDETPKQ